MEPINENVYALNIWILHHMSYDRATCSFGKLVNFQKYKTLC